MNRGILAVAMANERVCGLVLAAGGSRRLGQPKQLLPFRGATLLDAVMQTARACPFDQLVVAVGGASDDVRSGVDLSGAEVVVNAAFGSGCSSSIAAAMEVVDADVLVLLLGDMPGVTDATVRALLESRGGAGLAVCRYDDGVGHPFAFASSVFGELRALHGDKAVWKLLDARGATEVRVGGDVPLDVDTWADYEAVLAAS
jgi:molybdenum cofactor cytidylyltransferase